MVRINKYRISHKIIPSAGNKVTETISLLLETGLQVILKFFSDYTETLPENGYSIEGSVLWIHTRLNQFLKIVDTLRNEKPVHFSFSEATKIASITTDPEVVGEEEFTPQRNLSPVPSKLSKKQR